MKQSKTQHPQDTRAGQNIRNVPLIVLNHSEKTLLQLVTMSQTQARKKRNYELPRSAVSTGGSKKEFLPNVRLSARP